MFDPVEDLGFMRSVLTALVCKREVKCYRERNVIMNPVHKSTRCDTDR
jgi:hypothetical protein